MIGNAYWTTGITLRYDGRNWSLLMDFMDGGWCDAGSTEGQLRLRYMVKTDDLSEGLDTLIADAVRLGIEFKATPDSAGPTLYVPGDGEHDCEVYHRDWRKILSKQAKRLGWRDVYGEIDAFRENEAFYR